MSIAHPSRIGIGLLALCALAVLVAGTMPVSGQVERTVSLELVLAVDVSASVDRQEYELQVQGLARAFRDPLVLAAIRHAGRRGIAVAVVQWAAGRERAVAIDWTVLIGDSGVTDFADRVAAMPRAFVGSDTVTAESGGTRPASGAENSSAASQHSRKLSARRLDRERV